MAWIDVPKQNHSLFYECLPQDERIKRTLEFKAPGAKANGHVFGALFAHSFMVMLSDTDLATALAIHGAKPFDPMGVGRVAPNEVLMPESLMEKPDEMRAWLQKALDYVVTLPKGGTAWTSAMWARVRSATETAKTETKRAEKSSTKTSSKAGRKSAKKRKPKR